MNKNWKEHWKQLANNKANTALHHFQYCALKAFNAKSNAKKEIAFALLRRAFTPKNGYDWSAINRAAREAFYSNYLLGVSNKEMFEDEAEERRYKALVYEFIGANIRDHEPDYMFIFVRQDISNEQQAVQAAHATFVAGSKFTHASPDKVNFVLVGVRNTHELKLTQQRLEAYGCEFVTFVEPDLDNSITAIATTPLKEHQKRFLKKYKLLEFKA